MNPIQSLYDSNNAYQNIPLSLSLSPSPSLLPELIPFDRQAYATMTQKSLSSGELDNIQNLVHSLEEAVPKFAPFLLMSFPT